MKSLACLALAASASAAPLEIHFNQSPPPVSESAPKWESSAQPVGNGRIGAMVFGGTSSERIQFNDITLWTGGDNPSGGYDVNEFGCYQNFGSLYLDLDGQADTKPESYSRTLDLANGVHTTTWSSGGATITREVFASHADDAIVVNFRSTGSLTGKVRLSSAHGETTTASSGTLAFSGSLPNQLRYAATLTGKTADGVLTVADGVMSFRDTSSLTLILSPDTDYALDAAKRFRSGADPVETVAAKAKAAAGFNYDTLRSRHAAEFSRLMGRVEFDLGTPAAGDIQDRLAACKNGAEDPALEALMFHYGRYLLLSSSRGSLPANLQGLWNDSNKPAWFADYHTNINIQMNYWLAEPANLAECARPLHDWVIESIPGSRAATVKEFGADTPGWTMRTSVNPFGGNGWKWNLPSSAWLARHLWEHYAFTGDADFLKSRAWPIFKDVSEFWLDHLVERDGKLVVPNGWSPEHGPREDGVAHDQQIVRDLFSFTLEAATALRVDDELTKKVAAAREKLLGPKIGSWGQLMEWSTERPELEKSGHRHTSHLYAVYPGNEISLGKTPDLAKAAALSLETRGTSGDSRRSWTWAWRTALWARLGQAEKARAMIRGLLAHNTLANLFTTHPPFQIDGNLGITTGICEMLVQSHAGEVSVLPALPDAWRTGSFKGLRARGGFEIDASWKDGKAAATTVKSFLGNELVLRLPGNPAKATLRVNDGDPTEITATNGVFRMPTVKGGVYHVTPD